MSVEIVQVGPWYVEVDGVRVEIRQEDLVGSRILATTGRPSDAVGINNDLAWDSAAAIMYGPKISGAWPAGISLRGADGAPGANGADGAPGIQGEPGEGVIEGGTTGQILAKASEIDYDTEWVDAPAPTGAAGGSLTGNYPNPGLANAAISSSHIANNAVLSQHIATGAVQSTDIADNAISNRHIIASASIALSKLAVDPLARANHTGSQTANTISDFDTQVRRSRIDQLTAPSAAVAFNAQKITGLADPTAAQDSATKNYVDSRIVSRSFYTWHTFGIDGEATAKTLPRHKIRLTAGQAVELFSVEHVLQSGTSIAARLDRNGVGITGLTAISVTTTETISTPSGTVTCADRDVFVLTLSSPVGTPTGPAITLIFRHTI